MAATKSCPMCATDAESDAKTCLCGYRFASREDLTADGAAIAASAAGDGWSIAGWLFAACGGVALFFAIQMKTSVSTYSSSAYGPSEVVNLDLQFTKGLAIDGALFAIGLGVFCLGVGAIVKVIGRNAV